MVGFTTLSLFHVKYCWFGRSKTRARQPWSTRVKTDVVRAMMRMFLLEKTSLMIFLYESAVSEQNPEYLSPISPYTI